jgi:hypothetical protein
MNTRKPVPSGWKWIFVPKFRHPANDHEDVLFVDGQRRSLAILPR